MVYSYVLALGGVGSKIASYYIRANIRPIQKRIRELVPGAEESVGLARRIIPGVEIQIIDMAREDVINELINEKMIIDGDHFIQIIPSLTDYREDTIKREASIRKYVNLLRYWPYTVAGIVNELGPSRGVQRYRPLARIFLAKYSSILESKIDEDIHDDIVTEPPREGVDFLIVTVFNAGGGFGAGSYIDLLNIFRERYRAHGIHERNKDIYMVIVNIPIGARYRISPEHMPGRTLVDLYASSAATLLDYMYLKSLSLHGESYSDGIAKYIWERALQLEQPPNYALSNTHLIITTYKPFDARSIEGVWIKHDKFVANLLATINSNIKSKRNKLVPMFADNYSATISGLERSMGQKVNSKKYRVRDPDTGEEKEVYLPLALGITSTIVAIKSIGIIWGTASKDSKEIKGLINRIRELRAKKRSDENEIERLKSVIQELAKYIDELMGLKKYIDEKIGDSASTKSVTFSGELRDLYDRLQELLDSNIDLIWSIVSDVSSTWSSDKGHAVKQLNDLIRAFEPIEIPDIKAAVENKTVIENLNTLRNDIAHLINNLPSEKINELKGKVDKLSNIYLQYLAIYNMINTAIHKLEEILKTLEPIRERASAKCSEALIKRLSKDCSIANIIENAVEPWITLRIDELRSSLELINTSIIQPVNFTRKELVDSIDNIHLSKARKRLSDIKETINNLIGEIEDIKKELEEKTNDFKLRIEKYIRMLLGDLVIERIVEKDLVDLIVAKLREDPLYAEKVVLNGLTLPGFLRLIDEVVAEQERKGVKLPYSSKTVVERIKNYLVITDSDYSATVSDTDIEIFIDAFGLKDLSNILDVTRPRRVILYTEDTRDLLDEIMAKTQSDRERLREEAIPVEANGSLIMLVSYRSGVPLLAIKEFREILKHFFRKDTFRLPSNGEEKDIEEWLGLRYIVLLPKEDYIEMLRGIRYALQIYEEYRDKITKGSI